MIAYSPKQPMAMAPRAAAIAGLADGRMESKLQELTTRSYADKSADGR